MKNSVLIILLTTSLSTFGQSRISQHADFTIALGSSSIAFAPACFHSWKIGSKGRFEIGTGLRFTAFIGTDQEYITAPAELTSGKTGLGVIFTPTIEENLDTLFMESPQVNALNLLINFRYTFSPKVSITFNIDAIGFSFGARKGGTFTSNGVAQSDIPSTPTSFNLLLTSDNDLGSLNSELCLYYAVSEKWRIKAGFQFLFTEYTTETNVQTYPEENDRFRKKSFLFGAGMSYVIH